MSGANAPSVPPLVTSLDLTVIKLKMKIDFCPFQIPFKVPLKAMTYCDFKSAKRIVSGIAFSHVILKSIPYELYCSVVKTLSFFLIPDRNFSQKYIKIKTINPFDFL